MGTVPKKYYEELYFNGPEELELSQNDQDAIIRLLDKNEAVASQIFGTIAKYIRK